MKEKVGRGVERGGEGGGGKASGGEGGGGKARGGSGGGDWVGDGVFFLGRKTEFVWMNMNL